jgi:ATP-dependent helicase/nuclease subunit A
MTLKIDAITQNRQTRASDPKNTVWVRANAGSGKTHVLSQRVIRLLLKGTPPSKILCLTYTKTAAAEMINRVFERLSQWVVLSDAELAAILYEIEGHHPSQDQLKSARTLFARALETPGGLQIQTIHAFCTTILKRFPLEANIIGHFEVLDDVTTKLLKETAREQLIINACHGGDEELFTAFETALEIAGEHAFTTLCENVLSNVHKSSIEEFLQLNSPLLASKFLETEAEEEINYWPLEHLPIPLMHDLIERASPYPKGDISKFGKNLQKILDEHDPEPRFKLLCETFLTKGQPRKPKNYKNLHPNIAEILSNTADEILALQDKINRQQMLKLSHAAYVLLKHLLALYKDLKRARGFLDYDDLIDATIKLLRKNHASAWVHYKLDQGIDHVLIDEAQDTSVRQWEILELLTSDFFSGETSSPSARTLFVVGDDKQSIYSFQGAQPEVFVDVGKEKARALKAIDKPFEDINFTLSFRSTPEVLAAVDHVFDTVHESIRHKQHGRVEVWETIVSPKVEGDEDWTRPVDHVKSAPLVLAHDIGQVIQNLLSGQKNPATGEKIRPGDILILVRKRKNVMPALAKELKDRGIAVAGADKLILTAHIAILDLMACARFVLQPHDDLSLASVLKSPVFGMSEERLTQLCARREGKVSLMTRLFEEAESDQELRVITQNIQRWRDEVDTISVYEFFAHILSRDGARARFIGQLGSEASDVIDEFLFYAQNAEKSGIFGLSAFIETLTRTAPEIKREASSARNEVRIMTVHGAKGLESPYVFLVDDGGSPIPKQKDPLLEIEVPHGNQQVRGFLWVPKKDYHNSAIADQLGMLEKRQREEYDRLLYVGMTRAEDVLIVCGYSGGKKTSYPTWSETVRSKLAGKSGVESGEHPITKKPLLSFTLGETVFQTKGHDREKDETNDLPDWLFEKLPKVTQPRALTPSVTVSMGDERQRHRGTIIHKLLEMLPNIEASERENAARAYIARKLPNDDHEELFEKLSILINDARFKDMFCPQGRSEVAISGEIEVNGKRTRVNGVIDRLIVRDDSVLILDYKTGDLPSEIPHHHIKQLDFYKSLLKPLYPHHQIKAALIYTQDPHFIPL